MEAASTTPITTSKIISMVLMTAMITQLGPPNTSGRSTPGEESVAKFAAPQASLAVAQVPRYDERGRCGEDRRRAEVRLLEAVADVASSGYLPAANPPSRARRG